MYIVKYNQRKVKKEMADKLIFRPQFKKQVTDISPESFETFSYVNIDKEH